MKIVKRLARAFSRKYETDREDRFVRVARVMGVSEEHIEHELAHAEKARELGHEVRKYIIHKTPGMISCFVAIPKDIPLEDKLSITEAPDLLSKDDYVQSVRLRLGYD